jgi:hypothetical protein
MYDMKEARDYRLKPIMSREDSDKWLALIQPFHAFEWKWDDDQVVITMPHKNWGFTVLFGNLTKGITEYAFFCEDHLLDTSDDPFFVKSLRAFELYDRDDLCEVSYNSAHGWWDWKNNVVNVKTLEDLRRNYDTLDPKHNIWSTCLGRR